MIETSIFPQEDVSATIATAIGLASAAAPPQRAVQGPLVRTALGVLSRLVARGLPRPAVGELGLQAAPGLPRDVAVLNHPVDRDLLPLGAVDALLLDLVLRVRAVAKAHSETGPILAVVAPVVAVTGRPAGIFPDP